MSLVIGAALDHALAGHQLYRGQLDSVGTMLRRGVVQVMVIVTVVLALAVGGSARPAAGSPLSCRGQDGTPTDWFFLYKLPILHDIGAQYVDDGVGFLHFSSASAGERWTLSGVPINDSQSAAGQTLQPLYLDPKRKSLVYAFYNDEHPDGPTSFTKGHTKGVVAFDGDSGFWLVHSVPHYPPPPWQEYDYPATGHHYGQSFLCLTLSSSQLETVAQQLLFNEPYLYATQMPSSLEHQYPIMTRVIAGQSRSKSPWFSVKPLKSAAGQSFVTYAKARAFGKDLYSDLVAPALRTDLLTETWMNGPHSDQMPSNCSIAYPVQNVQEISVMAECPSPGASCEIDSQLCSRISITFRSSEDHSKWAVSENATRPWVCVGDINRMATQEERGGGTVCHLSPVLWRVYSQLVAQVEPCPQRRPANVHRRRL